MRSPGRNISRGIISSRRTMASPRPRSTMTLPYSTRLTTPLTISPMRSLYSSILPVALGLAHLLHDDLLGRLRGDAAEIERRQRSRRWQSPTWAAGLRLRASDERDLGGVVLDLRRPPAAGATAAVSPVLRVDLGADVGLGAVARARRLLDRVLHRVEHDLLVDRLSRATASAICRSSSLLALTAIAVTPWSIVRSSVARRLSAQARRWCRRCRYPPRPSCGAEPRRRDLADEFVGQDELRLGEIGQGQRGRPGRAPSFDVRQIDAPPRRPRRRG